MKNNNYSIFLALLVVINFLISCMPQPEEQYPLNGYSPYDYYFGEGVCDSTKNVIIVNAPESSDIVFLLRNIETKKVIRNTYIAKSSSDSLLDIPFGIFEFSYFGGNNWSDTLSMNNGKINGGFVEDRYFEKITKEEDRINFELDTIGRYYIFELTLSRVVNGNLETTPSNEVEFFSAELDDSY